MPANRLPETSAKHRPWGVEGPAIGACQHFFVNRMSVSRFWKQIINQLPEINIHDAILAFHFQHEGTSHNKEKEEKAKILSSRDKFLSIRCKNKKLDNTELSETESYRSLWQNWTKTIVNSLYLTHLAIDHLNGLCISQFHLCPSPTSG